MSLAAEENESESAQEVMDSATSINEGSQEIDIIAESEVDQNAVLSSRLGQFRALFDKTELLGIDRPIQAYVLPRTDAHHSEYLSHRDERVQFISGFSGTNAYTVITEQKALLWTDGRYFVQAEAEIGRPDWELMKMAEPHSIDPVDWIVQNLEQNSSIGFDPQLFGLNEGRDFMKKLRSFHLNPVPIVKHNLVDLIWTDRPEDALAKIIFLSKEEHGHESVDKITRVREKLRAVKCDAIILGQLDDIAWLFNIRGSDIPYNPVVFSIAAVTLSDVFLFVDERKLSPEVVQHLSHVTIFPYNKAAEFVEKYHTDCKNKMPDKHKVWLPDELNYAIGSLINRKYAYVAQSPVQTMKYVKNATEMAGMRFSHVRDSAACVQFLLWLERELELGHLVDELRAGKQMDYYRSQLPGYVSLSFCTISAADEHAALPHYEANEVSGKKLIGKDSVYLIDSGGQYRDGTTDVTRTVCHSATPDEHFRKMFTLVLRGHIDNATMIFPEGIQGIRLDMVSRNPMWALGYDFAHGVGHGVGHFLNVHEYPVNIGYRYNPLGNNIYKGQVLTIEPGYYEPGNMGIRIENCYEIVSVDVPSGAKNYLTFCPLTFVPIQKNLIVRELLSEKHINWLNRYHNRCLELVGKYLQEQGMQEEYNYLAKCCTPY